MTIETTHAQPAEVVRSLLADPINPELVHRLVAPDATYVSLNCDNVHLPPVRECWGPHELISAAGFFPEGDGGGLLAIAPTVFRNKAAMNAALASPETARVMADAKNVTAVEPQRSVGRPM